MTAPQGPGAQPGPASDLERQLSAGRFVVTAEVASPLSAGPEPLLAAAEPLKDRVDAINVLDAPRARAAMSSYAAAAILCGHGIEPILQVTCRDRNRIALAGDMLGAAAQGVRNILALHGDDPAAGDQPEAMAVFDLDSRGVLRLARGMDVDGVLPSGRAIDPRPRFFLGAADTPFDPPPDWRPDRLAAKVEAGARFVQTQFCFQPEVIRRYMGRLAEAGLTGRMHVLIGVCPLASARSARWMNENLFGVHVPDALIGRLRGAKNQAAEGRRICVDLIHAVREISGVSGVHIMAPGQGSEAIADVVADAGLGRRGGGQA